MRPVKLMRSIWLAGAFAALVGVPAAHGSTVAMQRIEQGRIVASVESPGAERPARSARESTFQLQPVLRFASLPPGQYSMRVNTVLFGDEKARILKTLCPGRYFVRVTGSPVGWMFKSATYNGRDVSETPLALHDEDLHVVLTYTDRWTGIAGSVTSASSAPDPDASVLVPSDPDLWTNYGGLPHRLKSTRTGKTGTFDFNSLPPGRYNLVAIPDERPYRSGSPDGIRAPLGNWWLKYLVAVADVDLGEWFDPEVLDRLAARATPIRIAEHELKKHDLRVRN